MCVGEVSVRCLCGVCEVSVRCLCGVCEVSVRCLCGVGEVSVRCECMEQHYFDGLILDVCLNDLLDCPPIDLKSPWHTW